MVVVVALPTALLCLLIAWMCLKRGYQKHAVVLSLMSVAVTAFAVAVVGLCWIWWLKIAEHFS